MKFKENLARCVAALSLTITLLFAVPASAQLTAVQTWAGTAGGSSTALTLTVHNVAALADLLGVPIRFLPSANGLGPTTVTINLDSGSTLGPVVLLRPTTNLGLQQLGSELISGVIKEITYDGGEFVITSPVDMTPVGNAVEVRNSVAPTGTLIEDGTCYTRTTYPALFGLIGTTYNAGAPVACTGTQFAVPDSRGDGFTAIDNQGVNGSAGRLTSASCSSPTTLGTQCGTNTQTLTIANIASFTPTGSFDFTSSGSFSTGGGGTAVTGITTGGGGTGVSVSIPALGSNTPHSTFNSSLLGVRAIKY